MRERTALPLDLPPLPSCSPNRVARDPAGVTVPPLPPCSPNRVARDHADFGVPPLSSCSPNRVARDPATLRVSPLSVVDAYAITTRAARRTSVMMGRRIAMRRTCEQGIKDYYRFEASSTPHTRLLAGRSHGEPVQACAHAPGPTAVHSTRTVQKRRLSSWSPTPSTTRVSVLPFRRGKCCGAPGVHPAGGTPGWALSWRDSASSRPHIKTYGCTFGMPRRH